MISTQNQRLLKKRSGVTGLSLSALIKQMFPKSDRKALFTRDILTHNIAIKRYCDKKIISSSSSKYCNDISKYYDCLYKL